MSDQVRSNQVMGYPVETETGRPGTMSGRPEPMQTNIMREVSFRQLSHGYMVVVGCQSFAIETASGLIAKLSEYILNPAATEQKWNEGKLF
jgi:hypothetical protein